FCTIVHHDSLGFVVDCSGPPPPPPPPPGGLPYVAFVHIGRPGLCDSCPHLACPGQDIPVEVGGEITNDCFVFKRLEVERLRETPPTVRLRIVLGVWDCLGRVCGSESVKWHASALLPAMPPGVYSIPVTEDWVSLCDSSHI